MAATGYALIADSQTASFGTEKTTYTCVFKVDVDSRLDGPKVVQAYLAAQGYTAGITYAIGNDSDSSVVLKSITPRRHPSTGNLWLVTLTYETPDSDDQTDENGDATSNPTEYYGQVETGFVVYDSPIKKAYNLQAFPLRPANTAGPVTTSAGEILIPAPTWTQHYMTLKLSKNCATFNADLANMFMNTINKDPATIVSLRIGFNMTIPPRCGKIANISGVWQREKGYSFYRVTTEIHVKRDPENKGWRHSELDAGICALARVGDPDGFGGVIASSECPDGITKLRHIKDVHGKEVKKPVLLDGNGLPAAVFNGAIPETYLDYITYPELEWGILLAKVFPR